MAGASLIFDTLVREDGLYGLIQLQGPDAEVAKGAMTAVREELDRLPQGQRSAEDLRSSLLAVHARLSEINAGLTPDEAGERKVVRAVMTLLSRRNGGFDIAQVGFLRVLVLRRGRLLLPLVPPHEKIKDDKPVVTEMLGSRHLPSVALAEATAEGGDLFAIATRSIIAIPEAELKKLLERAHAEDVTGMLLDRIGGVVTIAELGPRPCPEVGRAQGMEWAALSSVGMRPRNEDAYKILGDAGIFVSGDGLGGHEQGAVASRTAVDTAAEVSVAEAPWVGKGETARRAFELAGFRVAKKAGYGGSTLDLVRIRGREAEIAHTGDSRVYLLRDGHLRQITEDHSVVADKVRRGLLTAEEARTDPQRNVITRVVAHNSEPPDVIQLDLLKGDILLLCSDGLTGPVRDASIQEILRRAKGDVRRAATALVEAAYEGGALDNVTVVLVRIDGGSEPRRRARGRGPAKDRAGRR